VSAGMAIYDTMQFIKPDVSTLCVGQAPAWGRYCCAPAPREAALPAEFPVMIHQPMGGFQGQASDIEIHAKEILFLRERLNQIMAKHTGKSVETVATTRTGTISCRRKPRWSMV